MIAVAFVLTAAARDDQPKGTSKSGQMGQSELMQPGNQYLVTFSHEEKSCDQAQTDFHNALMSEAAKESKDDQTRRSDETGGIYGRGERPETGVEVPEHAMMSNWRFGCSADNKVSYLIINATSEKEAKDMVPKSMQKDLKVIKLQSFDAE